jgi:hypothetical protein
MGTIVGMPPLRVVRALGCARFSAAALVLFACSPRIPLDAAEAGAVAAEAGARPEAPDGGSLEAASPAEATAPAACTTEVVTQRSFATAGELELALLGLWRRCDFVALLCSPGDTHIAIRSRENSSVLDVTCGTLAPHGDTLIADRDASVYGNVEPAGTPGAPYRLHVWKDAVDTRFDVSLSGNAAASEETVRVSSDSAVLTMQRTAFTTY